MGHFVLAGCYRAVTIHGPLILGVQRKDVKDRAVLRICRKGKSDGQLDVYLAAVIEELFDLHASGGFRRLE